MILVSRLDALDAGAVGRGRGRLADPEVQAAVDAIIGDVRARGDAALRDLSRRFDGVAPEALEVPREAWDAALERLDPPLRTALEAAAGAVEGFHALQRPEPSEWSPAPGIRLGRRPDPLRRVGVYAPGGRATYPSSVLMGVVPARVAGVREVVVCSPPGSDGLPAPAVLAACAVGGADRVFAVGGAGAVAAMALGTATVPRVDRVVGPGNTYVAAAKQRLATEVGIDAPAGPSELLVVADDGADAAVVARELIAQAEHDPDAAVALVATSPRLARAVAAELERRVPREPRRDVIEAALRSGGALLVARDLAHALAFAERYAPEHLLLLVRDPAGTLDRVRCAGTVFLGPRSSVAFGDYATGANHVLPTGGHARSFSGLSVLDFVRWTTWQQVDARGAAALAAVAVPLARAEGLPAHAAAATATAADAAGWHGRSDSRGEAAPPEGPPALPRPGPAPRAAYRALERYEPVRPRLAVDLSANTSLWGACPPALEVLRSAAEPVAYPAPYATTLREALAEAWSVAPEQVTTGCGSDDLIDSAIRAFCPPGGAVAYPAPTFPMAEVFSRMNAARALPVATGAGLDEGALRALCAADVVYLCRPNNPTGALLAADDVARILDRARGLVLIDEAYGEFAGESMLAAALESGRGVVLRTFSKAYGLAGLRVGYALGPRPLVRAIELSRGPYKVGGVAEAAAVAAVRDGGGWLHAVVARAVVCRERLRAELLARGLRCPPSAANFVLAGPGAENGAAGWAERVRAGLASRGVGVRAFPALPGFGDAVRVTVGPWGRMERLLTALDSVLAPEPAGAAEAR